MSCSTDTTHAFDICLKTMIEFIQELFAGECYFRTHFHIYCPGCGGSRAVIALLQGDIIKSLWYNPITILFLLDVVLTLLIDIITYTSRGKYVFSKLRLFYNLGFLVFIVFYFLFRNYLWLAHGIDVLGDFSEFIN